MSSSVHVDNKSKDILFLGEGRTKGLDGVTLTAKAKNPIVCRQQNKRFVLSLPYNGIVSYLLLLQKYISSKQKTLK